MITDIKYNKKGYYCSYCRMIQKQLGQYCEFCGATFSNFEEMLLELYQKNSLDFNQVLQKLNKE